MRRGRGRRERDEEDDEERGPDFARALERRELGDRGEEKQVRDGLAGARGAATGPPRTRARRDIPSPSAFKTVLERRAGLPFLARHQRKTGRSRRERAPAPRPRPSRERQRRRRRERRQHLEGGAAKPGGDLGNALHRHATTACRRGASGGNARRARGAIALDARQRVEDAASAAPGRRRGDERRCAAESDFAAAGEKQQRLARAARDAPLQALQLAPGRRGPPARCRARGRPRGRARPHARGRSSGASAPTASSADRGDRRRRRNRAASGCPTLRPRRRG